MSAPRWTHCPPLRRKALAPHYLRQDTETHFAFHLGASCPFLWMSASLFYLLHLAACRVINDYTFSQMTTSSFLSLCQSPNAQKVKERAGTKFSSAKPCFVFIYDVVLGKGNFNVLKWKLWLKGHSVWAERTGQLSISALLNINIYDAGWTNGADRMNGWSDSNGFGGKKHWTSSTASDFSKL